MDHGALVVVASLVTGTGDTMAVEGGDGRGQACGDRCRAVEEKERTGRLAVAMAQAQESNRSENLSQWLGSLEFFSRPSILQLWFWLSRSRLWEGRLAKRSLVLI